MLIKFYEEIRPLRCEHRYPGEHTVECDLDKSDRASSHTGAQGAKANPRVVGTEGRQKL